MHVEAKSDYRKQRTIHNIADHLSVPPTANTNPSSLGVSKATTRGGVYSQISSEITSDQCCAVFAVNVISIWENNADMLANINSVYPLVNLNEISFIDLHYVPGIYNTLDYYKISVETNFTRTRFNSLCLFTKCLRGSYYVQLNTVPSENSIHHVVAVHVKQHWFKLSSPTDTVVTITDHSMTIVEVQKMDIEEAISNDSGVKIFQQLLGDIEFSIVFIHRLFPRVCQNST